MAITDYGLKWMKPGKDVDNDGLKDTLIISSKPILKYKKVDTGSIQIQSDGTVYDVLIFEHDLGYEPQYEFLTQWVSIDLGEKKDTFVNAPYADNLFWDLGLTFTVRPYMTTTEFRLEIFCYDGLDETYDIDYIYKVYYDPDADL